MDNEDGISLISDKYFDITSSFVQTARFFSTNRELQGMLSHAVKDVYFPGGDYSSRIFCIYNSLFKNADESLLTIAGYARINKLDLLVDRTFSSRDPALMLPILTKYVITDAVKIIMLYSGEPDQWFEIYRRYGISFKRERDPL